jgi:hypothetical protein
VERSEDDRWRTLARPGPGTPRYERLTETSKHPRQGTAPNCHAGGRGFESRRSRLQSASSVVLIGANRALPGSKRAALRLATVRKSACVTVVVSLVPAGAARLHDGGRRADKASARRVDRPFIEAATVAVAGAGTSRTTGACHTARDLANGSIRRAVVLAREPALLRPGQCVPDVRSPVAPWRDSELGLRLSG